MRRQRTVVCSLGLLGWLALAPAPRSMWAAALAQGAAPPAAAAPQEVFQRYCLACHNENLMNRGRVPIALDGLDLAQVGADAEVWERVIRKVRTGLMPPPTAPHPDAAARNALVQFLETGLDRAAAARPDPGRTEPFHRLNRVEYGNAVRDLLDFDVDVEALLPPDDASYGFDNIAGVLKVSPTLLERYLGAAQRISRLAVGTPPPRPTVDYFRVSDDLRQDDHLDGLPLGTRGGVAIAYTFPMDAEYVIRPRLARDLNESLPLYLEPQQLEVSLDGRRVELFTVPGVTPAEPRAGGRGSAVAPRATEPDAPPAESAGPPPVGGAPGQPGNTPRPRPQISQIAQGLRVGAEERQARNHVDDEWDVRVAVKAGRHEIQVAFVKISSALDETVRLPFDRPYPAAVNTPETRMGLHLRSVEVVGPYAPGDVADSPSRRRIFTCSPSAPSAERDCAETILGGLARRAYRRPVTPADLTPLLAMYDDGRAGGGFDAGIERAVKWLLVSPEFLFRIERDPADVPPGTPYRISDLELASRLSFFLWSSIPDDTLLDLAEQGRLRDETVLAAQVERMIADPRAETFVTNFAGQWLYLRNLPALSPVATIFPDFDESLRRGLKRETELFVDSIVREDRPTLELLTADYTFLNERVARHYGIRGIAGDHFRRVTLPADSLRRGLLGHGSILTVTSQPDRTSPVVRGKWILENFLGTSPPAPPPNVPQLKPSVEPGAVLSMRGRLEAHRANPVCAGCHRLMDPIGLSLENFDGVGRLRTLGESFEPIDASGGLPDGTTFDGVDGLREALLQTPDLFATTVTEKLLTYALGRGVEYYDEPAVRAIVREARRNDYRFSSGLILGVVRSLPFQMRRSHS